MQNEPAKRRAIPTEVYSRVVGYYRPVNQWNKGKQCEFWDRKMYTPTQEKIEAAANVGIFKKEEVCCA